MTLAYRNLTGSDINTVLDDLAVLRIKVFREWPYLYDGDLGYEQRYLAAYRESPGALIVAAFAEDRLVGAATGTPMEDHADEFGSAFAGTNIDLPDLFYCAESVLLPAWRGQGAGHVFFDLREEHARALGRSHVAFCAVVRPEDHPARPEAYRSLDGFWRKRGYRPIEGVVAEFDWRDIGMENETSKPLQFWMKPL